MKRFLGAVKATKGMPIDRQGLNILMIKTFWTKTVLIVQSRFGSPTSKLTNGVGENLITSGGGGVQQKFSATC